MNALVRSVTEYLVHVVWSVEARVENTLKFTDADVRTWAGLRGDEPLEPELIDQYASAMTDEKNVGLKSINDWGPTDVEVLSAVRRMVAPPEFVPLPGMEGL